MQLIEISSFKLFCCKLDSHKMFCCKKFCHKNVARKAKKFPAQGFPRAGKKKMRAGRGRWPCRAPPRCSGRHGHLPCRRPLWPRPRPRAGACLRLQTSAVFSASFFILFLLFFKTFFFSFFVFVSFFLRFLSPLLRFGSIFAFFKKKIVVQILCYCF